MAASRRQKVRTGVVTSDKMNKTRVVEVERTIIHPLYGKILKKKTRFKVHDEKNESKVGDRVKIEHTRPLSKEKRWKLIEILEREQ